MPDARISANSIRRRLLFFLIPSLLFLVLCAGVLTYGVALSVATSAYDRSLLDPALDMAENIRIGADGPHLDMLMQAQEALMYDHVDTMVFQIRASDGRVRNSSSNAHSRTVRSTAAPLAVTRLASMSTDNPPTTIGPEGNEVRRSNALTRASNSVREKGLVR